MSATDELRRMLDERGIEYTTLSYSDATWWTDTNGFDWCYEENSGSTHLTCCSFRITPAQAIAATLGESPRLPHFWTHDGALHVELPKLPESISVRLPDVRDREVHSARTWLYTLGTGTCKLEEIDKDCDTASEYMLDREWCFDAVYRCSCGCRFGHVAHNRPRYCPNCGAKVVEE